MNGIKMAVVISLRSESLNQICVELRVADSIEFSGGPMDYNKLAQSLNFPKADDWQPINLEDYELKLVAGVRHINEDLTYESVATAMSR